MLLDDQMLFYSSVMHVIDDNRNYFEFFFADGQFLFHIMIMQF